MKNVTKWLLGLALIPASLFAQPKITPSWSAKFSSAINWQRVHSLGYVLVCTSNALYAVDPSDGKISWENKSFAGLDPSMMQEVAGTEFLSITYKADKASSFPLQAIIKVMDGKVLFDSQKEGIGVLSRHVLPQSGRLLIMGAKGGDVKDVTATIFMYDIQSGRQLWMNDQLFRVQAPKAKGLLGELQALQSQLEGLQQLTSDPVETEGQFVIITHPAFVLKLNSATGELVWKNELMPSQKAQILFSPHKKDVVFIATEVESETASGFTATAGRGDASQPTKFYTNQYYAFNNSTGTPIWKGPAKEDDHLNQVIMHEKGLIVCPLSSKKPTINFIDYATGVTSWGKKGKGIKAEGSVVSYINIDKKILLTTAFDNAWNDKAEEYYLNVLDPATATFKYEKPVKLKGDLVRSELGSKGLLFITRREINIMDVNTGLLLWPNSIEAGGSRFSDQVRPFPVGYRGDMMFVYSPKDGAVYEVDKQAGTNRKITTSKVEFEGKELPTAIDVMADGLVISSEQNVMKIDFKGSVMYKKYYVAPREPALLRALYAAQALRAAYIGAVASTLSAGFAEVGQQATDPGGKAVGQELAKGFGDLGDVAFNYSSQAMKLFSARYKASQSTPDFVMMMTKQEKKGNQLIQVSKINGEILSSIDIKNDKEPEYDVDQILNHVYYRVGPAEIVCYKL